MEDNQHRSHADCAQILAANSGVVPAVSGNREPQDRKTEVSIEEPSGIGASSNEECTSEAGPSRRHPMTCFSSRPIGGAAEHRPENRRWQRRSRVNAVRHELTWAVVGSLKTPKITRHSRRQSSLTLRRNCRTRGYYFDSHHCCAASSFLPSRQTSLRFKQKLYESAVTGFYQPTKGQRRRLSRFESTLAPDGIEHRRNEQSDCCEK